MKENPKFSDREMLKAEAAFLVSLLLGKLPFKDLEQVQPQRDAVSFAIEDHLGLAPEQVKLNLILEDHFINPSILQRIHDSKTKPIVAGELIFENLEGVLSREDLNLEGNTLRDYLTRPGWGGSKKEAENHVLAIKSLLQDGYTLIPCDADVADHDLDEAPDIHLWDFSLKLIGSSVLVAGLNVFLSKVLFKNGLDKKQKVTKGLYGLSALLMSPPVLSMIVKNVSAETYYKLNEIIDEKENGESDFIHFFDRLMRFRNVIMSQNALLSVKHSVQAEEQGKEVVFFAGSSHNEIEKWIKRGPEKIEKEIGEYADILIEEMVTMAQKPKGVDSASKARSLFMFGLMFTEPLRVGSDPVFDNRHLASTREVNSPRTILMRKIQEKIELIEPGEFAQNQVEVLSAMKAYLLVQWAHRNNRILDLEEKTIGFQVESITEEADFGPVDYFKTFVMVNMGHWGVHAKLSGSAQPIVGSLESNGRIYPVTQESMSINDEIVIRDKVLLTREKAVVGNPRRFTKVNLNYDQIDLSEPVLMIDKRGQMRINYFVEYFGDIEEMDIYQGREPHPTGLRYVLVEKG